MARDLRADGWARVDLFDEVDSTNVVALDTAERWHLVAAHRQRAGRGRLDRAWVTPAGAAVTVSMTLPLPRDAATWGWVPLFVGDAVRAALAQLADERGADVEFVTKWPNDVLVWDDDGVESGADADAGPGTGGASGDWRKVAGVLCQVASGNLVVAGVGVNVAQQRGELPVDTATSTSLVGLDAARDEVLAAVAAHVARAARAWCEPVALAAARESVRRHCRTIGSLVDVHTPDGKVARRRGAGIDDGGRLVTTAPGERPGSAPTMAYSVADVVHARLGGRAEAGERRGRNADE